MQFSKHSLEQMEERNINVHLVQEIILNPIEIVEEDNLAVYHGIITENEKN